jgi:hypothetical protein
MIAPSAKLSSGYGAPRSKRRHGQHPMIISLAQPARHPFTTTPHASRLDSPARHPATLEPVTAPVGARAAHLSPATPARDHPHQPRHPSFAGTPRRQTHQLSWRVHAAEGSPLTAVLANGPCPAGVGGRMLQVDREFVYPGSGSAGAPLPSRSCPCRSAGADPVTWPDEVGLERLAHLYQCEGLSTYRIAELTGSGRQRVTRILRPAGVPLRPRGAGGRRPLRRVGYPADLSEVLALLYAHGGLTSRQVGALLGIPERTIRDRLRRYGIQVRSRGRWNREDRRVVPAGILLALYSGAGMTAAEVGHLLDG